MTEYVAQNIHTVLKKYQNTAPKSLQGPGHALAVAKATAGGICTSGINCPLDVTITAGGGSAVSADMHTNVLPSLMGQNTRSLSPCGAAGLALSMSHNGLVGKSATESLAVATSLIMPTNLSGNGNCGGAIPLLIKKEILSSPEPTQVLPHEDNVMETATSSMPAGPHHLAHPPCANANHSPNSIKIVPPPPPELSQPILSTADSCPGELYETRLEGKAIGCFSLGGEMRLCLPQFLNNVLADFTLDQINRIFDELGIFCSQCTPDQLMEFKAAKILPSDVKASGLITRTDAERLCSALLHRSDRNSYISVEKIPKGAISFKVYHKCFGKCEGICTPDLYSYQKPTCIMCLECKGWFSPQKFVGHVHRKMENRTCHWGFDSRKWHDYLHVALDVENREKYQKILDELKEVEIKEEQKLFELNYLKRKQADMLAEDVMLGPPFGHQLAVIAGALPPTPTHQQLPPSISNKSRNEQLHDIPTKKLKALDDASAYQLEYQRYQSLMYAHCAQQQHVGQISAFRPWAPPKSFLHAYNAAAVAALCLSQEPPVLQNPERVVRNSDRERFEHTYQPNVALAPRKNMLSKEIDRDREREREQRERELQHLQQQSHRHDGFANMHIKQERATTPCDLSPVPPPPTNLNIGSASSSVEEQQQQHQQKQQQIQTHSNGSQITEDENMPLALNIHQSQRLQQQQQQQQQQPPPPQQHPLALRNNNHNNNNNNNNNNNMEVLKQRRHSLHASNSSTCSNSSSISSISPPQTHIYQQAIPIPSTTQQQQQQQQQQQVLSTYQTTLSLSQQQQQQLVLNHSQAHHFRQSPRTSTSPKPPNNNKNNNNNNNNNNNTNNNILRSPEQISSSNEISSSTSPVPPTLRITTTNSIEEKHPKHQLQTQQPQQQQASIAIVNQHAKLLPSTTNTTTTLLYNNNNNYNELNNTRIRINKNLMLQPNIMRTPTPPQSQAPTTSLHHHHHQHNQQQQHIQQQQQYEYYKQRERYYSLSQQQQSPTTSHGQLRQHQQAQINNTSIPITGLNLSTNNNKNNNNNNNNNINNKNNNVINKYRNAYHQQNGSQHHTHMGSGEFELSTDTDDESINGEPDSSNVLPPWEMAVEALRDTRTKDRERVLQMLQRLLHDNQQYRHTNLQLSDLLQKRETQVRELNEQLQHCRKQIEDLTLTARLQQQQQQQHQQQQQPMQEEPENLKRHFSSTVVKADSCCQNEELRIMLVPSMQANEVSVKSSQPTSTTVINNETKELKVIKLERQKSDEQEQQNVEKLLYEDKEFEGKGEVLLAKRFKSEDLEPEEEEEEIGAAEEEEEKPNVENPKITELSQNVKIQEEEEEKQMSGAEAGAEEDEQMSELEDKDKDVEEEAEEQIIKSNITKDESGESESDSNTEITPNVQTSCLPTPTNDISVAMSLAEEVRKTEPKDEKINIVEDDDDDNELNKNMKLDEHNLDNEKNDVKGDDDVDEEEEEEKENDNDDDDDEVEKHSEAPHSHALCSIPTTMSPDTATESAGQLFDSSNSSDATAMKQAQMCASNAVAQITALADETNIDLDAENDAEMPDESDEEMLTNNEITTTTTTTTKLLTADKMLLKKKKKKKERKERKEKRKAAAAAAALAISTISTITTTTTTTTSSALASINSMLPSATPLRPMVTKASKKQTPFTHCDLQIKQELA